MDTTKGIQTSEGQAFGIGSLLTILGSYNGQIPPLYAAGIILGAWALYTVSRTVVKAYTLKYGASQPKPPVTP